jgi:hypothetical protein
MIQFYKSLVRLAPGRAASKPPRQDNGQRRALEHTLPATEGNDGLLDSDNSDFDSEGA